MLATPLSSVTRALPGLEGTVSAEERTPAHQVNSATTPAHNTSSERLERNPSRERMATNPQTSSVTVKQNPKP